MSKFKRILWNQNFLITEYNRVFNTKSNKYLKPSNVGGVNLTYKGKRKTLTIKQIALYTEIEQPQTLETWDQISDCKDFALSTEDRLKNIRFDKIIIPNTEDKLRFYNEKKILEMNAEEIRDYFFAEDEEEIIDDSEQNAETPAPEQKAEAPEQKSMDEDQWWDDDDDELIIDDFDDEGNEINHDSPKKDEEIIDDF